MVFPLKHKLSRWKKSRSSKDADNRTEEEYHRDTAADEHRKGIEERNNNADHDDGTAKNNAKAESVVQHNPDSEFIEDYLSGDSVYYSCEECQCEGNPANQRREASAGVAITKK